MRSGVGDTGMNRVDLVWMGNSEPPGWRFGRVLRAEPRPGSVAAVISAELDRSSAGAWLFWADRLGAPDPERVEKILSSPGDLWHAGLRIGMSGLPQAIDSVAPTWMLTRDPDPAIEATSWRVSLEACLVRTEVLRSLGGIRAEFSTLAGAALEFGHRCIRRGALARHVPWLLADGDWQDSPDLPFEDELRFIYYGFGRGWTRWAAFRGVLTGRQGFRRALGVLERVTREPRPPVPSPMRSLPASKPTPVDSRRERVTVLIPTVDRYPYLRVLLDQLRRQNVPPLEIIIIDQTPRDRRDEGLAADFPDLPLRVFALDRAGQCSSRNLGLQAAKGDFILFLDDDDEVSPDLIERHLANLREHRNDVSSGVAEEDNAGPLPEDFRLIRVSDVFPTNNSLIVKDVLARSGLFDLAYDRGSRADGDLGMRIYLSGALMVLNPGISLVHHHAPSGGLRTHRARVVTYASSRSRLTHRHLPSATEIYLSRRYYAPRQVREMLWLSTLGTFSVRGSLWRRSVKVGLALLLLPHSLWEIRSKSRRAEAMLGAFPQIPSYKSGSQAGGAG